MQDFTDLLVDVVLKCHLSAVSPSPSVKSAASGAAAASVVVSTAVCHLNMLAFADEVVPACKEGAVFVVSEQRYTPYSTVLLDPVWMVKQLFSLITCNPERLAVLPGDRRGFLSHDVETLSLVWPECSMNKDDLQASLQIVHDLHLGFPVARGEDTYSVVPSMAPVVGDDDRLAMRRMPFIIGVVLTVRRPRSSLAPGTVSKFLESPSSATDTQDSSKSPGAAVPRQHMLSTKTTMAS